LPLPTEQASGGSALFTSLAVPTREASGTRSKGEAFSGSKLAGPVHIIEVPSPRLEIGFSWAKAERTEWAVAKTGRA